MNKANYLSMLAAALVLTACGGSDGPTFGGGGGTGPGDPGDPPSCADDPTNPDCIPVDPAVSVLVGSGIGGTFQEGTMAVGVTDLSAGGQTNLTVTLVLESDPATYYDDEFVAVNFTSNCVKAGLATIDPVSVNTGTGSATATYIAKGCATTDVITANAVAAGGTSLGSATGSVTVAPADVNSISFVGADPSIIGLKGTGGLGFDETSDVTFRVVDKVGNPVAGIDVSFELDSTTGGIALSPTSATSDAQGRATTVVTSGTAKATVRVTASVNVNGQLISTQSDGLIISTGLPDQDSFSLALTAINLEALNIDGVQSTVTVRLADRYNNPVPDGTAVSFTAEAGSIQSSCLTGSSNNESGVCEVTWTSSGERPPLGRVTILATATGEEQFFDDNGNGVFDAGDATWIDIPEVYRDDDENGIYESGQFNDAYFFDFDNNQVRSPADGEFNGILCQDPARCEGPEKIGIGASGVIIMSGSSGFLYSNVDPENPATDWQNFGGLVNGVLDVSSGSGTVIFLVGDINQQPMAEGTTISFSTDNGELFTPESGGYTVPRTAFNGPPAYSFTVTPDNEPSVGPATLTIKSPSGIETFYNILVSDIPPP